ncbi:MAG: hypothetical protein HUU20_11005 [Pirellulales bacterium]|nr:hypothetical protein [Pirellulales bacterium]
MCRFWKQGVALLAVAAGLWCLSPTLAKPPGGGGGNSPSYTIVKLDDANGAYSDGIALGINNRINNLTEVVGYVHDPALGGALRAACWELATSGGTIRSTLSILNGIPDVVEPSDAYAVNDAGEIVGLGFEPGGEEGLALYWSGANAIPLLLPPLAGDNESIALAINIDGVICGRSNIRGGVHRAVVWRINLIGGSPVVWGPVALPDTGAGSRAYSMNDNDSFGVAAVSGVDDGAAVVWSVQSLADGSLTVSPIPIIFDDGAEANGINDADTACGYLYGTTVEAVVWTGSSRRILNRAKFVTEAYASDINNNGAIVGTGHYRRNFDVGDRAVVWPSATSSMILLDKFLVSSPFTTLLQAEAVNDQGQIAGWGWMGGVAQYGAFVAVPK